MRAKKQAKRAVEKAINKAVEVGVPLDELEAEFNRWLAQKEAPRPQPKREIKPVAPSTSPEELARLEAEFKELLEEEAGDKLFDIKYFMKRLAEYNKTLTRREIANRQTQTADLYEKYGLDMFESGSASALRKILIAELQKMIEHQRGIQLPKIFNFADFEKI